MNFKTTMFEFLKSFLAQAYDLKLKSPSKKKNKGRTKAILLNSAQKVDHNTVCSEN